MHLAARIGEPVDRPWVGVQVIPSAAATLGELDGPIRAMVDAELARRPEVRSALGRGEYSVC